MRLLLWPAALLVFLVWSLAAWLLFSVSDSAAGLVAAALSGILSSELGTWSAWVLNSLGNIIQAAVAVTWAIVGMAIMSAPLWWGRVRDRVPLITPEAAAAGYRRNDYSRWRDGDHDSHRYHGDHGRRGYGEIERLRYMAHEMADRYRKKKWKKKKDRDDDDD